MDRARIHASAWNGGVLDDGPSAEEAQVARVLLSGIAAAFTVGGPLSARHALRQSTATRAIPARASRRREHLHARRLAPVAVTSSESQNWPLAKRWHRKWRPISAGA
jgi:anti-sigma factor RsiW